MNNQPNPNEFLLNWIPNPDIGDIALLDISISIDIWPFLRTISPIISNPIAFVESSHISYKYK